MFNCLICNARCRREYCHKHHPESKEKHHQQIKKYRQTEKGQLAEKKCYENKKMRLLAQEIRNLNN